MTWFRVCLPGNCSCCAALWLNPTHFEELAVFAWADWAGFIQGSLLQVLDTLRRSCVSWCTWNNEGKYLANATPLVTHSNVKDGVWCGNKHMLLNHYVTVLCMLNWAIKACRKWSWAVSDLPYSLFCRVVPAPQNPLQAFKTQHVSPTVEWHLHFCFYFLVCVQRCHHSRLCQCWVDGVQLPVAS